MHADFLVFSYVNRAVIMLTTSFTGEKVCINARLTPCQMTEQTIMENGVILEIQEAEKTDIARKYVTSFLLPALQL